MGVISKDVKCGYNRKIQMVILCAHQGRTADPGIIGSVYRCFTTRKFNMNSVAKTLSTHNKIKKAILNALYRSV